MKKLKIVEDTFIANARRGGLTASGHIRELAKTRLRGTLFSQLYPVEVRLGVAPQEFERKVNEKIR